MNVTRGKGLLEKFLSEKRTKMADSLIPLNFREGKILDIGCGSFPLFLSSIKFKEKYGLDRDIKENIGQTNNSMTFIDFDLEKESNIPFEVDFFDVVTMLAVFEHIDPRKLIPLLNDINRILKPGGIFIFTTPAGWTGPILRLLAMLRLVSHEEIDEHKDAYSRKKIMSIIKKTEYNIEKMKIGYFEMGMNIYCRLQK